MVMFERKGILLVVLAMVSGLLANFAYADRNAQSFVYQGRFMNADGSEPLTDVVDITLGVYDPAGGCLLYEEQVAGVDLSQNSGFFAVDVGTEIGSARRTSSDPGKSMSAIFANGGAQILAPQATSCTAGYTPAAGDKRLLRVTVTPVGGTPTTLTPDQTIGSMPQAQVADYLVKNYKKFC
jgi:hypothetical protein